MDQLKSQVRNSFTKLRHALDLREKLLLRQIEVLNSSPDTNKIDFGEISFQTDSEEKTLEILRNYGIYQNIDCYLPYLENENEDNEVLFEKSFYDPSSLENKKLSESIINLTLKESQNLITKSKDLVTSVSEKLKVEASSKDIDKSLHSNESSKSIKQPKAASKVKQPKEDDSKLKRNVETTSSKKKTLKNISNLTLNNCGGNIVLKNISNLTINTCKASKKHKEAQPEPPKKPCTTSKSCDGTFYQCDFYERLISENEVLKRSIVNQSLCTMYPDPIATTCMSPPASVVGDVKKTTSNDERDDGTYSINSVPDDTTTTSSIMEEAEDGLAAAHREDKNISFDPSIDEMVDTRTMMVDGGHSPMIQCWLNKMLLETEAEAQHITEFLEISSIM